MISNEELLKINGGGISYKVVLGVIGAIVTFVIGVFDGYSNPKKCHK